MAEREIASKLRSKAFLISTAILFVLALAGLVFGGLAAQNQSGTAIAVTADAASLVPSNDNLEITEVADRAAAEKLVADGTVEAAIVGDPSAEPFGFTVVADSSAPTSLLLQFAQVPSVELLNPEPTDDAMRYLVAIGFGIVFLTAATCSARRSRRASSRRSRPGSSRSSSRRSARGRCWRAR